MSRVPKTTPSSTRSGIRSRDDAQPLAVLGVDHVVGFPRPLH
jgi:hypothetical protein